MLIQEIGKNIQRAIGEGKKLNFLVIDRPDPNAVCLPGITISLIYHSKGGNVQNSKN
jgi:hypothetical protein